MNQLSLLLKSNQLAFTMMGGAVFGALAQAALTPKRLDPKSTNIQIKINSEQYSHISANPEGCIRYATEVGIVTLFADHDATIDVPDSPEALESSN